MHMYGHEYYGGNGIVGAQVSINTCIELTVHWGASHVWCRVLLDTSLSSYTNFFSVYLYTFTYRIGENCNKFLFFNGIFF